MTSYILTVFDVLPTALQRYGRFINFTAVKDRRGHFQTSAAGVCAAVAAQGDSGRHEAASARLLGNPVRAATCGPTVVPSSVSAGSLASCTRPLSRGMPSKIARSGLRANTDRAVASPEGDRVMPSAAGAAE
jgi:hypothetical protein